MKVKVYVKSSTKTQEKYYEQVIAEAYAENESLFQKNRDLERQIVDMDRKIDALSAEASLYHHEKKEVDEWKEVADELADKVSELNDLLNAERRKTRRLESDMVEANEALEELEDTKRLLEACEEQLGFANERIAEQQKTIADCSDTIITLKTTAELRPKFSNLWQLLKDTGMIVDTEGGVHNHE